MIVLKLHKPILVIFNLEYWNLHRFQYHITISYYHFLVLKIKQICNKMKIAASWRKLIGASLPLLRFLVRVSVIACGFRGERNGVWLDLDRGSSRFPLLQFRFHHFYIHISLISFHFICPSDDPTGVVCRYSCYSRTFNTGTWTHPLPSHPIPRPGPVA